MCHGDTLSHISISANITSKTLYTFFTKCQAFLKLCDPHIEERMNTLNKLIIAEKPSVARAIAPVVGATNRKEGYTEGNGYIVSWCVGHLVALASPDDYCEQWSGAWNFDQLPILPDGWRYKITKDTRAQFLVLKQLLLSPDISEVICATDADREGECIFRYVYNIARCQKPVKRLWTSSLEFSAIKEGMLKLKNDSDYDNLYKAGSCRAKADWLIGMNATRLFSCRYNKLLNLGRVQTPTLAMVVKRDIDIKNFVKTKFFIVELDCGGFTAISEKYDNESYAAKIAKMCDGKTAFITGIENKTVNDNPPKLYDLTSLQRDASKKYGYTSKQTSAYAQSLYEGALISYPRTKSKYLTDKEESTIIDVIASVGQIFTFGEVSEPNIKRVINNDKVSGHHAIVPTMEAANADISALPKGERNILDLIVNRLLCAVSKPHIYEMKRIDIICENNQFSASGKKEIDLGWKIIENKLNTQDSKKEEKAADLPDITENQALENVSAEYTEHWTSPPKHYTEDSLLSAMENAGQEIYDEETEKKGLGTPATRADIIEGLVKHGYIVRSKKQILSTEKGVNLISVIPDEIKSPELTADWEMKLQRMENGEYDESTFIGEISEYVKQICSNYSSVDERSINFDTVVGKCPRCGARVIEGKNNYYCESGKDKCDFSIWKNMKAPNTSISPKSAVELLSKGMTQLKAKSKEGKEYTAYFKLVDTGKYVNLEMLKADDMAIGVCPMCGGLVVKGKYGYYCKNMCGMNVGRVFKKELTETQLKLLLSGKKTSYTEKNRKTIVLPEIATSIYQGKTFYQWKVQ